MTSLSDLGSVRRSQVVRADPERFNPTLTNVCLFDCAAPPFQRRFCDRRKTVLLQRWPVKTTTVPCGNFHHSEEDYRWWARLQAACLMRSWADLPPDSTLRVTSDCGDDARIDIAERKFIGRLRRRGVYYAWFREWTGPGVGRHLHLAVRTRDSRLDLEDVGRLWGDSLANGHGSAYAAPIDNLIGLARYLTGDCGKRVVLPPVDCRFIFYAGRGFLSRPLKQLKSEVRASWARRRFDFGPV